MAGRHGRDRFRPRDFTGGTGFDGGAGRYGQVLATGRDGRGTFCRRDGTVSGYFLDGTGRHGLTVGETVDGTGRDGTGPRFCFDDGFTVPSRAVVTVNTVPSINHEKPCN